MRKTSRVCWCSHSLQPCSAHGDTGRAPGAAAGGGLLSMPGTGDTARLLSSAHGDESVPPVPAAAEAFLLPEHLCFLEREESHPDADLRLHEGTVLRERCAVLCSSPALAFNVHVENSGSHTTRFRSSIQRLETRFVGPCFQRLQTPQSLSCPASPEQRGLAKEKI